MRKMYSEKQTWQIVNKGIEAGVIQAGATLESIKDADGHDRFTTTPITIEEIENVENIYSAWSVNGNQLNIVLFLNIKIGANLSATQKIADIEVPEWIANKLSPNDQAYLDLANVFPFTEGYADSQRKFKITKNQTTLTIALSGAISYSARGYYARVQFSFIL